MKILALELSSARGSIALLDSGERTRKASPPRIVQRSAPPPAALLFSREWPNDRKNSGPFFEHLTEVQKQFGKAGTIIVGLGPGSYAGTRIAISAAIGLRVASKTHLIGFASICALECGADEYCVIGDARRHTFFFALVRDRDLIEGPTLMTEAELREKLDKLDKKMPIFTTEKLSQFERAELRYPSAKLLGRLATDSKRQFTQPPLEPMYLREPHITVPKK
ncbi:MAG TPA: tRNA (adenosine(37)-N6)-threonylcarbamoyltransferase complex dimerization subunit type 1 TsaB [Chthoniobacterales bacterium]|nr:tRNA (adenosine(37)-N6)-threonylcarbamoyltransferase complex dimerization subunit type 1 TsaB [Chthoniobacterales bacterium]